MNWDNLTPRGRVLAKMASAFAADDVAVLVAYEAEIARSILWAIDEIERGQDMDAASTLRCLLGRIGIARAEGRAE